MPLIRLETLIDAPLAECFSLSLSVDAHTSSMRRSGERVVGGVAHGVMEAGETVTWRAVHFGVPWRMTSRITEHDEPHRFVDSQISGPFARWRHEHRFESSDARTRMIDTVDYAAPLGIVGRLADRLFLERYLTRLLQQRNTWLQQELEGRR